MKTGELFYGSVWRVGPDELEDAENELRNALEADDGTDINDLADILSEKHDAHVEIQADGTRTFWFGHPIEVMNDGDTDFNEMALLRVMDLKQGTLREDIKKDVKAAIENVPYALREKFSSPGFKVAWGDA